MASVEIAVWRPHSQADRAAVMAQLERLLSHHVFKGSRRCVALLRYIVEHHLQGESANLKERVIGIAVFAREADYDSNADPVVRTTANDLRKRLAQYYYELGHEEELRINLPVGSYVPDFRMLVTDHVLPVLDSKISATFPSSLPVPDRPVTVPTDSLKISWKLYAMPVCVSLVLAGAILWRHVTPSQSVSDFWAPIAKTGSALVCVGTWTVSSVTAETPGEGSLNIHDLLPVTDAFALSRVSGFLGEARIPFRVESAKVVTLSDLTRTPTVVIGALDNEWTMRVTDPLRFHFLLRDGRPRWMIGDRKNATGFMNGVGDVPDARKDYAIIARLRSGTSGQLSVVIAGVGAAATTAASEFVTDARYLDDLAQRLPKGLRTQNVEAVISVQVVNSKPGAPRIEAVEAW